MGLLAPILLSSAPTLIKGGLQALGGSEESAMEKKLGGMQDALEGKLDQALTERTDFKLGQGQLRQADQRNKESAVNAVGAGNYTNDAKLAVMESTNQAYGGQLNQLMANVAQLRDMDQSRLMGIMQALQGAKTARINEYNSKLSNILDPLASAGSAWLQTEINAPSGDKKKGKGKGKGGKK